MPRTVTAGSGLTWWLSALLLCFDDVCVDTSTKPIPDAGRRGGEQREEELCVPFPYTVTSSLLRQRVYLQPVLPSATSSPPLLRPLNVSGPVLLQQSPTSRVRCSHPSVLSTAKLRVAAITDWIGKDVKREGTRVRLPPRALRRLLASSCLSVRLSSWNNSSPTGRSFMKRYMSPSILSALQPWVSLGLLNNQSPLLSVFRLLHPLLYLHYIQVCYIIHPSQTRSSFSSAYEVFLPSSFLALLPLPFFLHVPTILSFELL